MRNNKTKKIHVFFLTLCLAFLLVCLPVFAEDEPTVIGAVSGVEYDNIADFAAAIGGDTITVDGTTLTLTDDIDLGESTTNKVIIYSDMTIDLAGHHLTGSVKGSSAYLLYINQEGCTVTITDSVSGGFIQNITDGYCKVICANKGTLIIDGTKIIGKSTAEYRYGEVFEYPCTVLTDNSSKSTIILQNGAQIFADCGDSPVIIATGIEQANYSTLILRNCIIDVQSGNDGIGIATAKLSETEIDRDDADSSDIERPSINVNCTGTNITSAAQGYGIKGNGNVSVRNCDITVTGADAPYAITCYGIFENNGSLRNDGELNIQGNVHISIENENSVSGVRGYGIYYSTTSAKMKGHDVSIIVNCPFANGAYGIYSDSSHDFIIEPEGDDTKVQVSGLLEGTFSPAYAKSNGKIRIDLGWYLGGSLRNAVITRGTFDYDPSEWVEEGYIAKENTPGNGLWTVEKISTEIIPPEEETPETPETPTSDNPLTGDHGQPTLWIVLMIVAVVIIVIAVLVILKARKKDKSKE